MSEGPPTVVRVSAADETFLDLALSRSAVDRAGALRGDSEALARALEDPRTRVLPLRSRAAPVSPGDRPALQLRAPRPQDAGRAWLLGTAQGVTHLAVAEDAPAPPDTGDVRWVGLRDVATDLDDTEAGLLTAATALAEWHHRHGHCPRCGAATQVEQGGWVRRCPRDGSEHHPRTDPAVIMAVTDADDRILLGSGVAWPPTRVSVLAGFVEAGESLESAVVREVLEEVGVEVVHPVYRGNQPWPFPASLMLGFRARATSTELRVDPGELRSAHWFTREELGRSVGAGELTLPSRASIARRLVEEWFGGTVPEPGGPAR